jgi:hypothetical protein
MKVDIKAQHKKEYKSEPLLSPQTQDSRGKYSDPLGDSRSMLHTPLDSLIQTPNLIFPVDIIHTILDDDRNHEMW